MIILTSTMGENYFADGGFHPQAISNDNSWRDNFQKCLPSNAKGVFIAASPKEYEQNDSMCQDMQEAFRLSDIKVDELVMCDYRNSDKVESLIKEADFVILSGGHVPTENAFFKEIGLKEILAEYKGTIVGISAGTMNCADVVYACPELPGESIDPDYQRYIPGLGLTNINVLPHYQYIKDVILDDRKMSDIALEDSHKKSFIALVDGSYIMIDNGTATLYGEAYLAKNGEITQINHKEQKLELKGEIA